MGWEISQTELEGALQIIGGADLAEASLLVKAERGAVFAPERQLDGRDVPAVRQPRGDGLRNQRPYPCPCSSRTMPIGSISTTPDFSVLHQAKPTGSPS
jgi:hypothetical protein